jgi:hypothetical protein
MTNNIDVDVNINVADNPELNGLFNEVFSLIEEELYQRLNPQYYKDAVYDGSRRSISGSSNLDISVLENEMRQKAMHGITNLQRGGGKLSSYRLSNYIPGKLQAVRYSYQIPLNVAIKGSIARQKLFMKEKSLGMGNI